MILGSHRCPCCAYRTLPEPSPGSYEICPLCGWEDDPAQFHDPELAGGANVLSLKDARAEFEAAVKSGRIKPPRED